MELAFLAVMTVQEKSEHSESLEEFEGIVMVEER